MADNPEKYYGKSAGFNLGEVVWLVEWDGDIYACADQQTAKAIGAHLKLSDEYGGGTQWGDPYIRATKVRQATPKALQQISHMKESVVSNVLAGVKSFLGLDQWKARPATTEEYKIASTFATKVAKGHLGSIGVDARTGNIAVLVNMGDRDRDVECVLNPQGHPIGTLDKNNKLKMEPVQVREGDASRLQGTFKFPDFTKWWKQDKKDLMAAVYWLQNQIPPQDPIAREAAWKKLEAKLQKKYPAPTQDRSDIDSGNDESAFDDYNNIEEIAPKPKPKAKSTSTKASKPATSARAKPGFGTKVTDKSSALNRIINRII